MADSPLWSWREVIRAEDMVYNRKEVRDEQRETTRGKDALTVTCILLRSLQAPTQQQQNVLG